MIFRRGLVTLSLLALSAAGLTGCTGDDLTVLAPKIHVNVCAEPQAQTRIDGEFVGGFQECLLDFGEADISVRNELVLEVRNPTNIDLSGPEGQGTPIEIFLTEDSDPAFKIEAAPQVVEGGLTGKILVSFRPSVESPHSGRLVIRSDAKNVPEGQDVIIELSGTGVDNGIPDILVQPVDIDFGRVAQADVAVAEVKIENVGNRALVFDEVVFLDENREGETLPVLPSDSEGDAFGFLGAAPGRDFVVGAPPEDNVITLTVRFTPDVLGEYRAAFVIRTNDPDEPSIEVNMRGVGVEPPSCNISVKSVNGIEVGDGVPTIEPLDDVILTAELSEPSTAAGSISSVEWMLFEKPAGSTVTFTNPTGVNTGFKFADKLGVDLAGKYVVRARVYDDLGTGSTNECEVDFEAIPSDSILIQLTWDTSWGDMDLHLTKKNSSGQFCPSSVEPGPLSQSCGGFGGDDDCYYANCKASNGFGRPDWDGDSGSQDGDPSLDVDDLSGYGPENINIDLAPEGEYLVGVDYFSGSNGGVGNTIRIYIYGLLVFEQYKELNSSEFWEVAVVNWPGPEGGSFCIDRLDTDVDECEE